MISLLHPNCPRAAIYLSLVLGTGFALRAQPPIDVQLPAPVRGAAAISALGSNLPEVARAYGLQAQGLTTLLRTQPSLGVDKKGALFYACDGVSGAAPASQGASPSNALLPGSSITQIASGTAVDAFQLHSLPGAGRVLYLDFTGHTTSGTQWNSNFTGGANIVSQPFDLDGSPSTFSASERALIQSVWQRVAEDYAPFAIDVTTQDPGLEGLRRTTSTDMAYGIRVVISPTNWYSSGAGGVGYYNSFSWSSDTPVFAFSGELLNNAKYIAEAAAHEAGHSVGLYHDGASGTEYYTGDGNWAPIMGAGYYKPLTQFSKGEYSGASNLQDDFAVIVAHAPLASDDHGNSSAAATTLAGPTVADGGTIETAADVDVFRFDTGSGAVSLGVGSPAPEANLHLQVELLNSAGQVLQTNNTYTNATTIATSLSAGTYYLRISGIGAGDPKMSGYSDYGSVGNYLITGSLASGAIGKRAPSAVATANVISGTAPLVVAFSAAGSNDSDGSIVGYRWDFGNGASSSAMNPSYTYNVAGSYTAVLTVTDNDQLTGTANVSVTVGNAVNQPPTAVASASVTSGFAPLVVRFSSAGSSDPDGVIASYYWDFGDGTTSNASAPEKTYSTPGTYAARLTITDNGGATASAQPVSISVATPQSQLQQTSEIDVSQFSLSASLSGPNISGRGTVVVRDSSGRGASGVTVTIQWSGLASGSSTAVTDATGTVILTSGKTKKSGTLTGTITSILPAAGGVYVPTLYAEPTFRELVVNP
jgi:PKD repeat protein